MVDVKMPHEGHEKHLCFLENTGFIHNYFDEYKKLVRNGKYVCVVCGRVSEKDEKLCGPERLWIMILKKRQTNEAPDEDEYQDSTCHGRSLH